MYKNAGIVILQVKYVGHVPEVMRISWPLGAMGRVNLFFVQKLW